MSITRKNWKSLKKGDHFFGVEYDPDRGIAICKLTIRSIYSDSVDTKEWSDFSAWKVLETTEDKKAGLIRPYFMTWEEARAFVKAYVEHSVDGWERDIVRVRRWADSVPLKEAKFWSVGW